MTPICKFESNDACAPELVSKLVCVVNQLSDAQQNLQMLLNSSINWDNLHPFQCIKSPELMHVSSKLMFKLYSIIYC